METDPAQTQYDGGIIFTSYLIAVLGAMTALELLTRRTHIRGFNNWYSYKYISILVLTSSVLNRFFLLASAFSMGGVGIWCMHFIGNKCLTIILKNDEKHSLSYSPGFTFLSLFIAIITVFLAFVFVGITEEAKISRIVPSGIIAGVS